MRTSIDIENVLFGAFVALLVTISVVMGTIVFDKPAHPVDKTIRTIVPATVENIEINQRFADEYRKIRPEIRVEMSVFPWRTITQKMEFLMMAGIPPDVVGLGPSELQRFIHLGAVEPLENWMRNDPDFDPEAFFPECLSDSNWDGVQWGVPHTFSTVCLWYNKSLFDKEGVPYPNRDWTWDDLLAAAKKITKDTDGDGLLDQWGFVNNNYHWNRMPMWIWMNGGEFMTPDLRTATFNTPGVIGGLAWLRDLSLKEKVSPSYATLRTVGPVNLFLSGKVGMTTETRYFLPQFRLEKNRDKTASFEWDVCELPRGVRRASTFVMSSNFMPSGISPERKKMAWDFIKFLSSETGQRIMASLDTSIPARKSVAYEMVDHPGKPPENDRAFIDSLPYMRFFYWPYPAARLQTEINSEFSGIWTGVLDPADVCAKADRAINAAMDEWHSRNPGQRLPIQTPWVPFDKRPTPSAAASSFPEGVVR